MLKYKKLLVRKLLLHKGSPVGFVGSLSGRHWQQKKDY